MSQRVRLSQTIERGERAVCAIQRECEMAHRILDAQVVLARDHRALGEQRTAPAAGFEREVRLAEQPELRDAGARVRAYRCASANAESHANGGRGRGVDLERGHRADANAAIANLV